MYNMNLICSKNNCQPVPRIVLLENIPTSLGLDETEKTPMIYHPFIGGYLQFTTERC